ncbi:Mitochondrial basic amino acids transporter [Grifola frondosa]|uniref:Mitochondrial basic amino acids transporter n=1 Tax=Grifola frondosa TaxID=5627 RepID=A0A1C7MA84_GRIFR|nr:Mitochondrial basic amino acids transporter [Grifola frondosa]
MDVGQADSNKLELDPTLDFFAGTVAGMAALTVGFPFDTVKVRFQDPVIATKYRSTFNAFFKIMREERVRGLYRGIAAPLMTAAPLNGLLFSSYRFLMKIQLDDENSVPTLNQIHTAGAGTGMISSLINTPVELIKVHQQTLLRSSSDLGMRDRDVALHILKQHGIRGLYRGITATALRDFGYGAYFASYEATLRCWPRPRDGQIPWSAMLVAGGVAGVMGSSWGAGPDNPYRSTLSTIIASYRAEGLGVFFRGLAPTLIRAIPVNMVTFGTFEAVVHLFS